MKKTFLLLIVVTSAIMAGAQVKEGTLIYESLTDIRSKVPEAMRAMMPAAIKMKAQLAFKDSIALYTSLPNDDNDNNSPGLMITRPPSVIFSDLANGIVTEQTEMGGTTYRIIDTLYRLHWRLVDSVKTIVGFSCKKATISLKDGRFVQAWYTENIPLPGGPVQFGNLPGMILAADDGEVALTAIRFVASVDKDQIKKPLKGKLINRKDYVEKAHNEMGSGVKTMFFNN